MKEEIAKEWVKALRSGKYKQGPKVLCSTLNNEKKYCCLGVLCHILKIPYEKNGSTQVYDTYSSVLSPKTIEKVGMKSWSGRLIINGEETLLTTLNDGGKSFKEIADIIEENWMQL